MEEIRKLTKLTKAELLDELVAEAEGAKDWSEELSDEELVRYFDQIENIIYVLKNCQYADKEEA